MIRAESLTKKYGNTLAVDQLSFELRPGAVTGFLGPNGSGKSTTMRCIVGLDRPTSGRATIGGLEYRQLRSPLTTVGALLDGKAFHKKRTARQHLLAVARTHAIPERRVDEVLELTGLRDVARKKVGQFSLGMSQRLGIAVALLGDPDVFLFDEPVNGLDPDGVRWVRQLMRSLAEQGRTVLVSSHLMSEMAVTADDLIIIGRGRLIASGPISQFTESAQRTTVIAAGPDIEGLARAAAGASLTPNVSIMPPDASHPYGSVQVAGVKAAQVGALAYQAGLELHELTEMHSSLEDVYMELTNSSLEYTIGGAIPGLYAPPNAPAQAPNMQGTGGAGMPAALPGAMPGAMPTAAQPAPAPAPVEGSEPPANPSAGEEAAQ